MKKYWWLIAAVLLLVVFFIQHKKIQNLRGDVQVKNVELSTFKDSIKSYITKNGDLIAKVQSIEVDKRNLKDALEAAGFEIKDLRDKDVKWRKITNALNVQIQSMGSGESEIHDTLYITTNPETNQPDTTHILKIDDWTNNYLSLFNRKLDLDLGKSYFDYTYNVKLSQTIEGSRKVPVVTTYLDDPNARIVTGNSITVPYDIKWYEKWWVHAIVFGGAGYFIAK